eukprot:CAMPEP_0168626404 /NCGR_PEP_ID=MMETSP0449_2-20121227/10614_1 /TAXON_ID=1082188 /ORGANISM="Strombidium rassoulzadegani, Strain ras09" /LENGTH=56 /DNA_ID=CAMNT_0008668397 /DNA_START=538 /DNA_END=705 /DNA_ORIENTATION=+
MCFDAYDADASGYLSYMELMSLLKELNLDKQFSKHFNPQYAFQTFCQRIWRGFDRN